MILSYSDVVVKGNLWEPRAAAGQVRPGASHPAIAQSVGNYAAALRGLKRDSEAEKCEARIAAIRGGSR